MSLNSYFFYFSPFHAPSYHPLFPWIMEPDEIASSEVLKVVINGSSDSRDLMVSHFLLRKHPDRQFHICLCQYLLYQPKGSVGCPPLPGLGRGGLLSQPLSAGLLPRSLLWERSWWLQSVLLQLSHISCAPTFLSDASSWKIFVAVLRRGATYQRLWWVYVHHFFPTIPALFFFTKEKKGDGVKEERVLKWN